MVVEEVVVEVAEVVEVVEAGRRNSFIMSIRGRRSSRNHSAVKVVSTEVANVL
jgi:hypothetical protein